MGLGNWGLLGVLELLLLIGVLELLFLELLFLELLVFIELLLLVGVLELLFLELLVFIELLLLVGVLELLFIELLVFIELLLFLELLLVLEIITSLRNESLTGSQTPILVSFLPTAFFNCSIVLSTSVSPTLRAIRFISSDFTAELNMSS
jgi:hypothetical protein